MAVYPLRVNSRELSVQSDDPNKRLLYVLRDLGLTGAKFGCGLGQCGACTVLVDGQSVRSCMTAVSDIGSKAVTTIEGLGTPQQPSALQAAFIAESVPNGDGRLHLLPGLGHVPHLEDPARTYPPLLAFLKEGVR